jgi:hypothetical protein
MRNKLVMGAAALALLGVLGHFGAKPLMAQIRAALVRNIDEPGRSPYLSASPIVGLTPFTCIAEFAPVPPNKRLVVQYISGYTALTGPSTKVFAILEAPNLLVNVPRAYLSATLVGGSQYVANQEMVLYVEPGGVPRLRFEVSNVSCTAAGTLSGHLIDLNQ